MKSVAKKNQEFASLSTCMDSRLAHDTNKEDCLLPVTGRSDPGPAVCVLTIRKTNLQKGRSCTFLGHPRLALARAGTRNVTRERNRDFPKKKHMLSF